MRPKDEILGQIDRIRHIELDDNHIHQLISLSLLEVIIDLRDIQEETAQYLRDDMIARMR